MNNTWNELDAMFDDIPGAQPIHPQPVRVVPFPDVRQNVRPNSEPYSNSTSSAQSAHHPHSEPHGTRTPSAQLPPLPHDGPYTAVELAQRYPNVQEGAIRTRWFGWINQVLPEQCLKSNKRFTPLAVELFDDFYCNVKAPGSSMLAEAWVNDARRRFAQQQTWADPEVVEAELLGSEVKGTLVLADQTASRLTQQGQAQMDELLEFIASLNSAEAQLSETEIEIAEQRGVNRAVELTKIELTAEARTRAMIRKKMMGS